ncbi:MAG: hypothetical protein R3321_07340, partial [Nitrososphaeraceae archaeon]|nr:hypothetical protein [Nitrososphaeraceae archaeon]
MEIKKLIPTFVLILIGISFSNQSIAQDFITPVVNCVSYNENTGDYTAYFGYINEHDETIVIANGKDNKLTPGKHKGQPTEFLPGTHSFVFEVTFNGADLTWHIDSDPFHVLVKSTTANSRYRSCSDVATSVVNINDLTPVPNVEVSAINAGLETSTNSDGFFSLSPIASDDTIKFSLEGYVP